MLQQLSGSPRARSLLFNPEADLCGLDPASFAAGGPDVFKLSKRAPDPLSRLNGARLGPSRDGVDESLDADASDGPSRDARLTALEHALTSGRFGELIAVRLSDPQELVQRASAARASAKVTAAQDLADLAEAAALS